MWAGLLFGLTAGGVGQLVAVPADLIKVRTFLPAEHSSD